MSQKPSLEILARRADEAKISELPALDFMSPAELLIPDGAKIYTVIQSLNIHKVSGAPVVDGGQRLLGMISEYDLLMQAATRDLAQPIQYRSEVKSVTKATPLREVLVIFYKTKFRRLPVINENKKVIGMVSRIDILNRLIKGTLDRPGVGPAPKKAKKA